MQQLERKARRALIVAVFGFGILMIAYSTFRMRQESRLREINHELVCMLDDQYADFKLRPSEIGGKTYYCCSDECVQQLTSNSALRVATDPLTNEPVDKAKAITGITRTGRIFYFQTIENLQNFHEF